MYQQLENYLVAKTGIDKETFQQIAPYFTLRKVKRKEVLLRSGEVCKYNYFINKGCLKFSSIHHDGKESIRHFAFENKFGTDLASFSKKTPSTESIQAIENSEILAINRKDFFFLVDTVPAINLVYRDILEMAYITMQHRIYDFQGASALDRLRWLMQYQPKILSRLPSRTLASYLGISSYTLSRLKAAL